MAPQQPTHGLAFLNVQEVAVLREIIKDVRALRKNLSLRHQDEGTHQSPEIYVAKPIATIPALTEGTGSGSGTSDVILPPTPGSMTCDIYQIRGDGTIESLETQQTVYNLGKFPISVGWLPVFRDKFGKWLAGASSVTTPFDTIGNTGGSSRTLDCGCCDCFNCIPLEEAGVTTCSFAPDGASNGFVAYCGNWVNWPALGGAQFLNWMGGGAGNCTWASDPIPITNPMSQTGTYQWVLNIPAEGQGTFILYFISGVDVISL